MSRPVAPWRSFDELQNGLGTALAANRPGSGTPHTVVAMASHSVNESLLSHYGDRVLALEHRFLVSSLMTQRLRASRLVYLSSLRPSPTALDYLRRLGPDPAGFTARTHVASLDDHRPLSMATKLLDQPHLLARLRDRLAGGPAVLEPWNVTEAEVAVAEALQVPINGLAPQLRPLGYKSAGRRLFAQAGAPVPLGVEDVRTVDDVVLAMATVRAHRPRATAVVVKHDDSGAGDGNAVVGLVTPEGRPLDPDELRAAVLRLPEWYRADLRQGGVVEELLAGTRVTSPSCQIDLLPDGTVDVLGTHEQRVGGENGQVFLGCTFPADPAYAGALARHAAGIGQLLTREGACGRASIDFGAVLDEHGRWQVHTLEVNLRKGGTSHPYSTLRNLVPGHYEPDAGCWVADEDGLPRAYACTDNFVDPAFRGLPETAVIRAVRAAGVEFDHRTGTGVVLHMLAGLAIDGRFGYTAIGRDPQHALELEGRARDAVQRLAARHDGPTESGGIPQPRDGSHAAPA